MNLTDLKSSFYKRYSQSENFLYFASNGLLCTLLGHSNIYLTPSITCTLSMRVKMFARKIDGNIIRIEDTSGLKLFSYTLNTPPNLFHGKERTLANHLKSLTKYGIKGAEILYDCSIPDFISPDEPFAVTLTDLLMTVSKKEHDILTTARESACENDITPYLGITAYQSGYCTLLSTGRPKNLPLPLTGYKILSAHCMKDENCHINEIKYAFRKVSRTFPHVMSVSEITEDMLKSCETEIKDKTALRYMYHLVTENKRIQNASNALKRCDVKTLFNEMNYSQCSMETYWDLGREKVYLVRLSQNLDGVKAVRAWKNGIVAIIEDDFVDYAASMIVNGFESRIGYKPSVCISEPS